MLPWIIEHLTFRSENRFQPVLEALAVIKQYVGTKTPYLPTDAPVDGVVLPSWRETVIEVRIRWRTEALTDLIVPRAKRVADARRTDPQVIARVRELAPTHTATHIATLLNEEGLRAGLGGSFTASKVEWIRAAYNIPLDCPEGPGFCPSGQRGDGRYSVLAAAELLNVNVSTIADWCNAGKLDCVRAGTYGPRWIRLTPEIIAELRKPVQRHWKRRLSRQRDQNMVQ